MKYLCLVYHDETKLEALSPGEFDALVGECGVWVEELQRGGHHVLSAALQSVRAATTLRSRNGALTVTDGPFSETKEFLGGFTLIDARDLNEAVQLAAQLPAVRVGTVEVRPLLEPGAELADPLDRKLGAALGRGNHA